MAHVIDLAPKQISRTYPGAFKQQCNFEQEHPEILHAIIEYMKIENGA